MDRNNPDDYAPGERYIPIVELMLEYKMSEEYSVYYNAAVALHTIASQHPFNNGNKRTASATALMILKNEGIHFTINEETKTNFIKDIATPEKNITQKQAVHIQSLINQKAIESPGNKKKWRKFWS